jgi:hypothetical protein
VRFIIAGFHPSLFATGILMARSSTFIWKESRSHVEGSFDVALTHYRYLFVHMFFSRPSGSSTRPLGTPIRKPLLFRALSRQSLKCHPVFASHGLQKCLAMPVTTIIWNVWTRLCKKCIKAE